jgi:hypothetical protein
MSDGHAQVGRLDLDWAVCPFAGDLLGVLDQLCNLILGRLGSPALGRGSVSRVGFQLLSRYRVHL